MDTAPNTTTTDAAAVRVGHVHLRVADLDRSLAFYRDALGFRVSADARPRGIPAVFLSAGDSHHDLAINTFETAGASPAPAGHTGLYHVAFAVPDRGALRVALQRLYDHGVAVGHGSDHGATVSLYLADPDGNGVELYYDRPRDTWFDAAGRLVLKAERFDPGELLRAGDRSGLWF